MPKWRSLNIEHRQRDPDETSRTSPSSSGRRSADDRAVAEEDGDMFLLAVDPISGGIRRGARQARALDRHRSLSARPHRL